MSGFLRNLSSQALGWSAPVQSAARLPHAALPATFEPPAGDQPSSPLDTARVASVAALPDATDRFPRRAADIPHEPLPAHAVRELADQDPAAPPMTRPAEPVAAARVPMLPPLVPTATRFVPPPAFTSAPLAGAARTAGAHRHSTDGENTEVHVSIGRIELTAVQEASPPARRAAPVKPSLPLHDYLARRQREAFVSNALALAGVTAVLRDLLNDRIVNENVAGVIGETVTVTALPPDRVAPEAGPEATQLNIFLRQVTANLGWRNEGLPSRDGSGRTRLSNPPLALDLHYLLSAYGAAALHAEIVLGYAMQLLHENPVLTREAIRVALQRPLDEAATLPPELRALADSGLQDQVEQLRITPEYLNSEELSKFWTAAQARYRSSAAYQVSVVLIQALDPARSPLPVLSRQIFVRPDLLPPVPTIEAVVPDAKQPVAQLDKTIGLSGHHLGGTGREVVLVNDRFKIEETLPAVPDGSDSLVEFSIPIARAADFPVGVYRIGARVQRSGEPAPRDTNQLAMTLAPQITGLPMSVSRDGSGTASFTINFLPALRGGQTVSLVLGQQEFAPQPFTPPVTAFNFVIPNAPVAKDVSGHLARLRIDGIDSPIIDPAAAPPTFLNQRIKIQ